MPCSVWTTNADGSAPRRVNFRCRGGGCDTRAPAWTPDGRLIATHRQGRLRDLGGELADATDIYGPIQWEDPPDESVFAGATRLSRLNAGEQFLYTFDMGDDWTHLCAVAEQRIDPLEALGIIPDRPLPYWGWGEIPDQYGRRSETDDGETPLPPDPQFADLPPLRPWWGRP